MTTKVIAYFYADHVHVRFWLWQKFYARLPDVKGTAGGCSFIFDEVLPASPAHVWTVHNDMAANDPLELFPVHNDMVHAKIKEPANAD